MEHRRRFIIVSNMRSGSTLLETMLGALPGVFADKEVKWLPPQRGALHVAIDHSTTDLASVLDQALDAVDAELVGSKLVFDPVPLTEEAQLHLRGLIPPDWFVIHLTRSYKDVFLSRRRGVGHLRNERGLPIKGPVLREAVAHAAIGDDATIARSYVDRPSCYRELTTYLDHDLWISSLAQDRKRYYLIDYKDIFSHFRRLVSFLRLDAFALEVDRVMDGPPLKKLPEIAPERVVANVGDLEPVFASMECLRKHLVLDGRSLGDFLPTWEAYQTRGIARSAQGDYLGAISDFTAAVHGAPQNPALLFLRGSALLESGDFSAAAVDFEAALVLDPDNLPLHNLLAQARGGDPT